MRSRPLSAARLDKIADAFAIISSTSNSEFSSSSRSSGLVLAQGFSPGLPAAEGRRAASSGRRRPPGQQPLNLGFGRVGAQHDDWRVRSARLPAELVEHALSRQVGQVEVQQDEVGKVPPRQLEAEIACITVISSISGRREKISSISFRFEGLSSTQSTEQLTLASRSAGEASQSRALDGRLVGARSNGLKSLRS